MSAVRTAEGSASSVYTCSHCNLDPSLPEHDGRQIYACGRCDVLVCSGCSETTLGFEVVCDPCVAYLLARQVVSWTRRDTRYIVQICCSAYHLFRDGEKTRCGTPIPAKRSYSTFSDLAEASRQFLCARCDRSDELEQRRLTAAKKASTVAP